MRGGGKGKMERGEGEEEWRKMERDLEGKEGEEREEGHDALSVSLTYSIYFLQIERIFDFLYSLRNVYLQHVCVCVLSDGSSAEYLFYSDFCTHNHHSLFSSVKYSKPSFFLHILLQVTYTGISTTYSVSRRSCGGWGPSSPRPPSSSWETMSTEAYTASRWWPTSLPRNCSCRQSLC